MCSLTVSPHAIKPIIYFWALQICEYELKISHLWKSRPELSLQVQLPLNKLLHLCKQIQEYSTSPTTLTFRSIVLTWAKVSPGSLLRKGHKCHDIPNWTHHFPLIYFSGMLHYLKKCSWKMININKSTCHLYELGSYRYFYPFCVLHRLQLGFPIWDPISCAH